MNKNYSAWIIKKQNLNISSWVSNRNRHKSMNQKSYIIKDPHGNTFFREREVEGFFTMTKEGKKLKNKKFKF